MGPAVAESDLLSNNLVVEQAWNCLRRRYRSVRQMGRADFFQASYVVIIGCLQKRDDSKGEFAGYVWRSLVNALPKVSQSYDLIQISSYFRNKAKTDPEVRRAIEVVDNAMVLSL